ncbi:nitroreductase family protein [Methylomonas koyamae]|uniref:nitroreductase family protein n=1 Tax=Methylomonas koyamae TaxID=702114 RepID=UPI000AA71B41|nr:nitroreductase family protein [Methylomonas koyamae]
MHRKPAQTSVEISGLIAERWSPRAFAADRPVSRRDLTALMEAARWAPSCFNDQPGALSFATNSATAKPGKSRCPPLPKKTGYGRTMRRCCCWR